MINIVYSANYKYFKQIIISAVSIANHSSEPVCFNILTIDASYIKPHFIPITEGQRKYLEDIVKTKNKDNIVRLYNIQDIYKKANFKPSVENTPFTPYALLRLFIDQIEGLDNKVIYLDTDTISNSDIKELYDIDNTNYELVCVRDVFIWGLKNHRRYFNSGMMLINIDKIKKSGLFAKIRNDLNIKKSIFIDQDALNYNVKELLLIDRKFNRIHGNYKNAVIHHMCDCRHHLVFRYKSSDLKAVRKYKPFYIPLIDECEKYISKAIELKIL